MVFIRVLQDDDLKGAVWMVPSAYTSVDTGVIVTVLGCQCRDNRAANRARGEDGGAGGDQAAAAYRCLLTLVHLHRPA